EAVEDLLTWAVGIEIADVADVGVALAERPHRRAVVVERGGAEDDLVAAVAVDVSAVHAVGALPVVRAARLPAPHSLEVGIERLDRDERVRAAHGDDVRAFSVEVRDAKVVPADMVVVVEAAAIGPRDLLHDLACPAVDARQVLGAALHLALGVARI